MKQLDLADLASIRALGADLAASLARLDLLILNAGVMACPKTQTKDGFEMQASGCRHKHTHTQTPCPPAPPSLPFYCCRLRQATPPADPGCLLLAALSLLSRSPPLQLPLPPHLFCS